LQVLVHDPKLAIHLLKLKGCLPNEGGHAGRKGEAGGHAFADVFAFCTLTPDGGALTHRGNDQRNVVLVHVALFTQEFTVGEKAGAGR
jgi:hypothetical protein